jgi:hypothetical protein
MRNAIGITFMLGVVLLAANASAGARHKFEGYAEWRKGDDLIIDGRRVRPAPHCSFKGKGAAHDFNSIPLGYEVKVEAEALPEGGWLAHKIEAKPNSMAMFESDILHDFDAIEDDFIHWGRVFDVDHGCLLDYGRLIMDGPDIRRVRRIVERLLPPYLDPGSIRVYVVEHDDWNAVATPNGAVLVNMGLLDSMDDDELALVLACELVHMTHEHARRKAKKRYWADLVTLGGLTVADHIDSDTGRAAASALAVVGGIALQHGYSRKCEEQAYRVGLRYAIEAGYDISRAQRLSERFAARYGDGHGRFFKSCAIDRIMPALN